MKTNIGSLAAFSHKLSSPLRNIRNGQSSVRGYHFTSGTLTGLSVEEDAFSTVGTLNFTERKGNYAGFSANVAALRERTKINELRITDIAHRKESTPNAIAALIKQHNVPGIEIVPHWTLTTSSSDLDKAREEKLEWLRSYIQTYNIKKVFFPRGNARTAQQEHLRKGDAPTDLKLLWEADEILPRIRELYPNLIMSFAGYPDGHVQTQKLFPGDRAGAVQHDVANLKKKIAHLGENIEITTQHSYDPQTVENYVHECEKAGIPAEKIAVSFYPLHLWDHNMAYTMNKAGGVPLPEDVENMVEQVRNREKNVEDVAAFTITPDVEKYLFDRSVETLKTLKKSLTSLGVERLLVYSNNQQEKTVDFFQKSGLVTDKRSADILSGQHSGQSR